jgi:DNA modification methylase
MPILTWPTKSLPDPDLAHLMTESIIFPRGQGYPDAVPENHLILGNNLKVMAALLPEYEGRFDLIYADPPFFTNKHYPARIGRGEDSRRPKEWELAEGYGDHWSDMDAYLDFLYPRLALMYRLLAPHGTLYLHLDWHADACARLILDELFGRDRFLNEIIWAYHGPSPIRRAFNRKHDTILVYTKTSDYIFNVDAVREPYNPNTVKTFAASKKAGFGKVPNLERGKVPEDWWYFPVVARLHNERTGYPTQKPEALLERILLASSNMGGMVADFFCGSGTFPLVAARHGRRFIGCDATWRAIHTARVRLLSENQSFTIQRDANSSIPSSISSLSVSTSNQIVTLKKHPALDYWEVDPAWDGKIFRSVGQARRPNRSGELPIEIKLPVAPEKFRVRAVTVSGEQIEFG